MKQVSYTDAEGRKWATLIPDDADDSRAEEGIPLGPPPLDSLELPPAVALRLHNELFARALFTERDVLLRTEDVASAVRSALKLSVSEVIDAYRA